VPPPERALPQLDLTDDAQPSSTSADQPKVVIIGPRTAGHKAA
jgi:hypothetical protein